MIPTTRMTRTATPPTTPPTIGPTMLVVLSLSLLPPSELLVVLEGSENVDEGNGVAVDSGPPESSFAAVIFHISSAPIPRYAQLGMAVPRGISYGKLETCTLEQLNDHRIHEMGFSFWQVAQAAKSVQVTVPQLHGSSNPIHGPA